MKILVTGAAGFIGSHFVEKLLSNGHEVIGIDGLISDSYSSEIKRNNRDSLPKSKLLTFFEFNLLTGDYAVLPSGITHIVHFAAMPGLPKSWTNFDLYAQNNIIATNRLAEYASKNPNLQKFIFISTSSVYGLNGIGAENANLMPISPYGVTKLSGEYLLDAYRLSFDLPLVILRYFSVYGPRQRPDMAYHIFIDSLLKNKEIQITGDGNQSRSNTFVQDAVEATYLALISASPGAIFNICGGERIRLIDAVHTIASYVGSKPKLRFIEGRAGDQKDTAGNFDKAKLILGYSPATDFASGIVKQISWQKNYLKF